MEEKTITEKVIDTIKDAVGITKGKGEESGKDSGKDTAITLGKDSSALLSIEEIEELLSKMDRDTVGMNTLKELISALKTKV